MNWHQHPHHPTHYGHPQQVVVVPQIQPRSVLLAYVLWFFFGFWGIHRFYAGDTTGGVVWLLTGGLCGFGWLIDIFLIPGLVDRANRPRYATIHTGYR